MQIDPIAGTSVVTQALAIGVRNQTNTVQTGSDDKASAPLTTKEGEIKQTFPAEPAPDAEQALRSLEEAVKVANISLNFSRDEETGAIVVKLVDLTSGETVNQIPSEAILRLAASLGKLQGQIFNQKA